MLIRSSQGPTKYSESREALVSIPRYINVSDNNSRVSSATFPGSALLITSREAIIDIQYYSTVSTKSPWLSALSSRRCVITENLQALQHDSACCQTSRRGWRYCRADASISSINHSSWALSSNDVYCTLLERCTCLAFSEDCLRRCRCRCAQNVLFYSFLNEHWCETRYTHLERQRVWRDGSAWTETLLRSGEIFARVVGCFVINQQIHRLRQPGWK